ncbi:MAG: aryl-sulfate sulfotransferase [Planctomycetota bacterium]
MSFRPVQRTAFLVSLILAALVFIVGCDKKDNDDLLPILYWLTNTEGRPGAVPWEHPDATTHYYRALSSGTGLTWDNANEMAVFQGGYLATLTSQEENDFVFGRIDDNVFWLERPGGELAGPWLGAIQPSGSAEPVGNWQWVTNEPFGFSCWSPGMPDEFNSAGENRIHFGEITGARAATWNDIPNGSALQGYVVEFSDNPAQTVGVFFNMNMSSEGFTLFAPQRTTTTYLIDNDGRIARKWESNYTSGQAVYLLENGNILRSAFMPGNPTFNAGGSTGIIQEIDNGGTIVWEFQYSTAGYMSHHDVEMLPNGNVLMIAWELKTAAEAIAAGRDPASMSQGELWPDYIIEVEPALPSGGNIVWEWHVWNHLVQDFDAGKSNYGVVSDHPELVNINFYASPRADWNHSNSVDYNEEFDQIMISVRLFSEIWVIDHSTTTAEAAGHTGGDSGKGGDLLYRWGNPGTYKMGGLADQKLFVQHDAQWIEDGYPGEGNIIVFNNGDGRLDGQYSTVDEIIPPVDMNGVYSLSPGSAFGPSQITWTYAAPDPTDFYASHISGTQRLPNGNTLICDGVHGTLFEVTMLKETVWKFVNPRTHLGITPQGDPVPQGAIDDMNRFFKARRYPPDYPGVSGL